MQDYIVEAKSRKDLREYALHIRKMLKVDNEIWFPIVSFLEILAVMFPNFNYEIVEDNELDSSTHADTDVINETIRIKESVYDGAFNGNGRDRMTIAHEIGHYLTLCVSGFKLQRNFTNQKPRAYEDPEWQAKCFAGELLVPEPLVKNMSVDEIQQKCGVSFAAAAFQYKQLHR